MTETTIRRQVVTTLAGGAELAIHLHTVEGAGDGPTVGLCAAIHGNEPTGTLMIRELMRRIDRDTVRGRLLLLPVANPPAYAVNRRHSPIDDLNLNRLFPGNPAGWVSEQLAHVITEEFLNAVDVLIDIHSGGDRPTVDYVYLRNDEGLSRAFGSRVLYRADPARRGTMFAGTSVSVTEERGVPSVTVELGGGVVDQREYVTRGVQGIENMLRHMGVLDGSVVEPPEQIVVSRIETLRPTVGGVLENLAPPLGDRIARGAPLGRVVSPYTFDVVEEIANPVADGVMILSHLTPNVVEPGDYGFMVGGE